ncbi:MAG: replication factor C small subunit [Desulfurococcales archaeon]|jgi:replication factor C small subunit|uniref:Replication factor C small subunit n=1 Tax=Fervidicoccus fontis TaxID=683846 RepID=A0A7J3SJ74_9CREN
MHLLWAEKYRPKSLDDIVNQEDIVVRLKKFVEEKNVPHMLFTGPPGTGKTTAALAFAHDLYGESYQQYILEMNASDERGIDDIRTKVKEFARARVVGSVPFKLIILDEADNMTSDAQQALRRMMENFTATSRFILIANYGSKIIEPIQSRAALFRFVPLSKELVVQRLKWIASKEKVEYDERALEVIYEICEGDMRRAINLLQSSSAIGKVTVDAVYKVMGLAHPKEIREMVENALEGKFDVARERLRKLMIEYGLSGVDIIKQVHREIFSPEIQLSEEQRVLIADYTGEILYRMVEGADDEIQMSSFLAWLVLLGRRTSQE